MLNNFEDDNRYPGGVDGFDNLKRSLQKNEPTICLSER